MIKEFKMTEIDQAKKAFKIGFICIFTYVMSYYLRNILGVLTPSMIKTGVYQKEYLALLSSTYMIVYAAGQLLNGIIGDYIKPKYMVASGLVIASLGLFTFSFVHIPILGVFCFAVLGFGLSMLRGPLVKVISENTLTKYARICCVFLSFASFAGPLLAGLIAMVFQWNTVFIFSAIITFIMAIFSFSMLTVFEKCGMIIPIKQENKEKSKQKFDLFALFKLPNFIPYMFVGMVVEIAVASISYWMPTFFNEHLILSETASRMTFSAISLIRSICPFLSLFIFKMFKQKDVLIVRTAFSTSAVLFLILFFVKSEWLSLILFTFALMCSSISSSVLWSIYIPSLGKSGKVSSVNGVLDCSGYIAAALANLLVVPIMDIGGWSGVIISWCVIMAFGASVTLFAKNTPQEI